MKLPLVPEKYTPAVESERNRSLEVADRDNYKHGQDVQIGSIPSSVRKQRLLLKGRVNGNSYSVEVDDTAPAAPGLYLSTTLIGPVVPAGASGTIQYNNGGAFGGAAIKINGGILFPTADSTTAVQIDKADGTTNVLTVDTTNGRVGIGTNAPAQPLSVKGRLMVGTDSTGGDILGVAGSSKPGGFQMWKDLTPSAAMNVGLSVPGSGIINNDFLISSFNGTTWTERVRVLQGGNVGIGVTAPTAALHLPASTAAAGTASLKITPGVVATTPVSGNIESDGTHLYWTDSGNVRHTII